MAFITRLLVKTFQMAPADNFSSEFWLEKYKKFFCKNLVSWEPQP